MHAGRFKTWWKRPKGLARFLNQAGAWFNEFDVEPPLRLDRHLKSVRIHYDGAQQGMPCKVASHVSGNKYTADVYEDGFFDDSGSPKTATATGKDLYVFQADEDLVLPNGYALMACQRGNHLEAAVYDDQVRVDASDEVRDYLHGKMKDTASYASGDDVIVKASVEDGGGTPNDRHLRLFLDKDSWLDTTAVDDWIELRYDTGTKKLQWRTKALNLTVSSGKLTLTKATSWGSWQDIVTFSTFSCP